MERGARACGWCWRAFRAVADRDARRLLELYHPRWFHGSATAFAVLKLAGAAYLVWLGVRALGDAWRGVSRLQQSAVRRPERIGAAFRQGLLSNLPNPKIALVFTTLIPQFVGPEDPAFAQTILLAAIFIGMGLVWLTSYALLVGQVGELLRRPAVRRALNAIVGTVLTAFGVRLALAMTLASPSSPRDERIRLLAVPGPIDISVHRLSRSVAECAARRVRQTEPTGLEVRTRPTGSRIGGRPQS